MLGTLSGGRDFFTPRSRGGKQPSRDLIAEARSQGYGVLTKRNQLALARGSKLLGLFATANLGYALDRRALNQPRLSEITDAALRALSRDRDGFFLMVEGSLIDYAGHANDPVALVHEVLDFEAAFERVMRFARGRSDTLVVSSPPTTKPAA